MFPFGSCLHTKIIRLRFSYIANPKKIESRFLMIYKYQERLLLLWKTKVIGIGTCLVLPVVELSTSLTMRGRDRGRERKRERWSARARDDVSRDPRSHSTASSTQGSQRVSQAASRAADAFDRFVGRMADGRRHEESPRTHSHTAGYESDV